MWVTAVAGLAFATGFITLTVILRRRIHRR
jgi:hypothetical protein